MAGIDEYSKLVLHGETIGLDSSPYDHDITNNGYVFSEFGGKFDDRIAIHSKDNYDDPSGLSISSINELFLYDPFVIDFWGKNFHEYYYNSFSIVRHGTGFNFKWDTTDNVNQKFYIIFPIYYFSDTFVVYMTANLGTIASPTYDWSVWHHVAFVHSNDTFQLFIDGEAVYLEAYYYNTNISDFVEFSGTSINISPYVFDSWYDANGNQNTEIFELFEGQSFPSGVYYAIDEFRISVDTDRGWTSDFTPPTAPYSESGPGVINEYEIGDLDIQTDLNLELVSWDLEKFVLESFNINSELDMSYNFLFDTIIDIGDFEIESSMDLSMIRDRIIDIGDFEIESSMELSRVGKVFDSLLLKNHFLTGKNLFLKNNLNQSLPVNSSLLLRNRIPVYTKTNESLLILNSLISPVNGQILLKNKMTSSVNNLMSFKNHILDKNPVNGSLLFLNRIDPQQISGFGYYFSPEHLG